MKNQVADPQMLLTLKTVQRQLVRLINHFPGHGRTVSSLEIIAPDYLEAFKGMYDLEFIELVDIAINEQGRSFFPTIGDLKEVETGQRAYNPYGGSGSLSDAEKVMEELSKIAKEPPQEMSEESKKLLAAFFKKVEEDVDFGNKKCSKEYIEIMAKGIGGEMPKGD